MYKHKNKRSCDRLISAEKILQLLKRGFTGADIVSWAEEFGEAPANHWISVDDKLPERDKTVLVWYASDTLFGVSEGYGLSWYHGSWRVNDLNGVNIRIFYWQYLPEKPKDGDTNG